jgi:hypothetical protein
VRGAYRRTSRSDSRTCSGRLRDGPTGVTSAFISETSFGPIEQYSRRVECRRTLGRGLDGDIEVTLDAAPLNEHVQTISEATMRVGLSAALIVGREFVAEDPRP